MQNVYYGDWNCLEDMLRDFQISKSEIEGYDVLYAWYEYADYSGTAFVLLKKGRKLYEVNGGHCSCMGLDGQFELEETSAEALSLRKHYGVSEQIKQGLVDLIKGKENKKKSK